MLRTFTDSFAASLPRWPGSKLYDLLGPGDAGRVRLFLCLRIFDIFDDLCALYVEISHTACLLQAKQKEHRWNIAECEWENMDASNRKLH